jgi:lipid II:glycine glycyltransferase (peptidoglycan interpeptide bridge formation enzyme)
MLIESIAFGQVSIAYIPGGPVGNWMEKEIAPKLFSELHQIANSHKAVFLKVEPLLPKSSTIERVLHQHQFRTSSYTNQAATTIIIDITPSFDDILAGMHQKTRYNIRYAKRKGVVVREGNREDLIAFSHLLRNLGRREGFAPRNLEYLEAEWDTLHPAGLLKLFVATYQEKILSIHMSALFGENAIYLHGASSDEYKNLMPNYLIMWESIKWAKSQGCKTFDLWGIPEEVGVAAYLGKPIPEPNSTKGLWGVFRFKKGFSSNIVLYMKAYDYVYNNFLYTLISNKLFNTNTLEHIAVLLDSLRNRSDP